MPLCKYTYLPKNEVRILLEKSVDIIIRIGNNKNKNLIDLCSGTKIFLFIKESII